MKKGKKKESFTVSMLRNREINDGKKEGPRIHIDHMGNSSYHSHS